MIGVYIFHIGIARLFPLDFFFFLCPSVLVPGKKLSSLFVYLFTGDYFIPSKDSDLVRI